MVRLFFSSLPYLVVGLFRYPHIFFGRATRSPLERCHIHTHTPDSFAFSVRRWLRRHMALLRGIASSAVLLLISLARLCVCFCEKCGPQSIAVKRIHVRSECMLCVLSGANDDDDHDDDVSDDHDDHDDAMHCDSREFTRIHVSHSYTHTALELGRGRHCVKFT